MPLGEALVEPMGMIFVGKHNGRPVARIASVAAVLGIVLLGGCGIPPPTPKCHEIGLRVAVGISTLGFSELFVDCEPSSSSLEEELRAGAERGNADAQYELSLRTRDYDEKRKWTCLAANQEHRYARFVFGRMEGDPTTTYMWYSLADLAGHPTARNFLDDLSAELTSEQIVEGERLAAEWKPDPASCEIATSPGS